MYLLGCNEFFTIFCANCCGQIFVDKIKHGVVKIKDPDSVNLGVDLGSGLGVFDAFFASLSMILVSEVSKYSIWYHTQLKFS